MYIETSIIIGIIVIALVIGFFFRDIFYRKEKNNDYFFLSREIQKVRKINLVRNRNNAVLFVSRTSNSKRTDMFPLTEGDELVITLNSSSSFDINVYSKDDDEYED